MKLKKTPILSSTWENNLLKPEKLPPEFLPVKQQGMIHFCEWSAELDLSDSPSVCALAWIPEVCSTSNLPRTSVPYIQSKGSTSSRQLGIAGQTQSLLQDSSVQSDRNQMGQALDKDNANRKRTQGRGKKEKKKEKQQQKFLKSWQASFLLQFWGSTTFSKSTATEILQRIKKLSSEYLQQ